MKITEHYNSKDSDIRLEIDTAKYLGDHAIRIIFNDGSERLVDFKSFLSRSQHPSIRKYLKEKLFAQFKVVNGNLNWNNFDMIFPILDLYKGEVIK